MKQQNNKIVLIILVLLGLASTFYLSIVYKDTFGERDSFRMAMGIIDSIISNKPLGSSMLYGRDISFAYFGLLNFFTPIFKTNLALIIPFMNYINALSAICMVIPLFFLVKRYWGTSIAILANILLMLLPAWRATSQYAHPMTEAILFMFIGLALISYRSFISSLRLGWNRLILLDVLIIAALALCLMFRLDAILMFPLIPACLLLENYSFKKIVSSSILYSFFPIIIFKVMQSQLPKIIGHKSDGIFEQLLLWNNPARYVDKFVYGNLLFIWGLNPLLCLIFLISCIYLVYKRNYLSLFFILPTVLLNYIFWLPNPAPARHFIYLCPVVAISIAIFLADIFPIVKSFVKNNRNIGVTLAVILIVSLSISYKFSYPVPMSEKYSHTTRQLGKELQQLEPKGQQIFVVGDTIPAVVQMQLMSKDTKVEYKRTNILTDDDIKAQEKSALKPKPIYISVIVVENQKNKFICYFQGWKSKINEIKRFLGESDEYNQGYIVLNMIDKYTNKIDVEASTLSKKLEVLKF
ncbi:hypothetical protein H6G97_22385 [Nostoc flagelliforme FACHB-838]|uniref:Glycosyltransferase RgtA/B/C/D-like domain-containing protein n=1 Tax=Nostoc flagelliforme FACHB-838 TaxID=2692904 RepID=A0ABR8DS43_9NOSO|nr:hypothetical protein [Nostoc flagelliforme]MBD2532180.1 hypothetical protein [Nostoc flagelliforme FACHB-838]